MQLGHTAVFYLDNDFSEEVVEDQEEATEEPEEEEEGEETEAGKSKNGQEDLVRWIFNNLCFWTY